MVLLVLGLTACDTADTLDADADADALQPGTFSALVTASGSETQLAGRAQLSDAMDDFTGAFESYPIATEGDRTFTFSVFKLMADSGDELILGYISDQAALESGTYQVEQGRNLTPPYDFVGVVTSDLIEGRGGTTSAIASSGTVELTIEEGIASGSFTLNADRGVSISGQFSARM